MVCKENRRDPSVGAYTWRTVPGTLNSNGKTYSFTRPDKTGNMTAYTSPYYDTHTRLRRSRQFGILLLRHASRLPVVLQVPLLVYVHPTDPRHAVLVPGVPLLAVYQLLLLFTILVPVGMALPLLRDILRKRPVAPKAATPILAAFLFYFLSMFGASLYLLGWGYLLRTLPPAWPLVVWLTVSGFLFFCPRIARWLYGYKFIRRGVYLGVIFGILPVVAVSVGLSLPYVLAAAVALMALTVLIKPFARAGHKPLYALLISLFWVPVYICGLLAPSRALVQLLHELLPYMPCNIDLTGIENPRVMAGLDVVVGLAGIGLSILVTYIDSTWRARQAAQVEILPTSRARSVTLGLVELQGRARPLSAASGDPILHYNSRDATLYKNQPFYLEDDTGRILIDPGNSRFRTGWKTSFGGRITEIVLKSREQRPELSRPHAMTLLSGDPVYVIGTAQVNPAAPAETADSGRRVVRRRQSGFFSTPFWQISQGKLNPEHAAEDIFFLTDSKEQVARGRIMKGLWQVWAWALLWISMSLAMFHFQLPRTQPGYHLWTLSEIIQYAPPAERLEAVLAFLERGAARTDNQTPPLLAGIRQMPHIGPLVDRINNNLRHAQINEGSNYLWRQQFKDPAAGEVDLLIHTSGASSPRVRRWAVARLKEAPAYPGRVVPVLITALEQDPDLTVKKYAAASLATFKKAAFPAIPALTAAARDPEYKLRHSAIVTLTSLDDIPDGPARELFLEMVVAESDWMRHAGVRGLKKMAHHPPPDIQALLERTTDLDMYTRSLALGALNAFAPDTPGYSEAVLSALQAEQGLLRRTAVFALADFKTLPDEVAAPLWSLLMDKSLSGRAMPLLVKMGGRAVPAVPYLARALAQKEGKVAYNAAFVLSRIGIAAAPAVAELLDALGHKDKFVRRYSAQALGGCGAAAVKALPALMALQKDPYPHVRRVARRAVAQIRQAR